jgi:hypothetical protein
MIQTTNTTRSVQPSFASGKTESVKDTVQSASSHLEETFTESFQGHSVVYGYDKDGHLAPQGIDGHPGEAGLGFFDKSIAMAKRVIFPPNVESSVSKDYMPTRAWHAVHQLIQGTGGFAVGAANLAALAGNGTWGAAIGGGAAMATFNMIRNSTCNATGFLSSFQVDKAEKNPRGWMVAGEALSNAGMAIGALGAVPAVVAVAPAGLLGITLAGAAISTVGGVMKGAAMANVNQRQAIDGNLAQVNIANSHQDMVTKYVASTAGAALMAAVVGSATGSLAIPVIAAATGVLGTAAMTQWVKNLDYHPVTESGLREVVDGLEQGSVPSPSPDHLSEMLKSLTDSGCYSLGSDHRPATRERLEELKGLYQGHNYLLDIENGTPFIAVNEKCGPEDRCQAIVQAIHAERLKEQPEYAEQVRLGGQEAGDQWLIQQSLNATPKDMTAFLESLKQAGWSTDIMKFTDTGRRTEW